MDPGKLFQRGLSKLPRPLGWFEDAGLDTTLPHSYYIFVHHVLIFAHVAVLWFQEHEFVGYLLTSLQCAFLVLLRAGDVGGLYRLTPKGYSRTFKVVGLQILLKHLIRASLGGPMTTSPIMYAPAFPAMAILLGGVVFGGFVLVVTLVGTHIQPMVECIDPEWARVRLELSVILIGILCLVYENLRRTIFKELHRAQEEAKEASKSKTRFLAAMTHELRTPLANVEGISRLLSDRLEGEDLMLAKIAGESASMVLDLVGNILDIASAETGNLVSSATLRKEPFVLHDCVDSTIKCFKLRALNKGLTLENEYSYEDEENRLFSEYGKEKNQGGKGQDGTQLDEATAKEAALRVAPERLSVRGDMPRLRQVLLNLYSNAFKFTEQGTIMLRTLVIMPSALIPQTTGAMQKPVDVARNDEGAQPIPIRVRFEVQDSGIGIKEADQTRLFKAFSQLEAGQLAGGGAGLGLVVSRDIIRSMGGEMGLRSQEGIGSTFWAEIPCDLLPQRPEPSLQLSHTDSTASPKAPTNETPTPFDHVAAVSVLDKHLISSQSDPGFLPCDTARPHGVRAVFARDAKTRKNFQGRRPRVLIVDDNKHNRVVVGLLLKAEGCKVDQLTNGQEAVDSITAGTTRYDMVFMDLLMPGLSGMDATAAIRKWEADQSGGERRPLPIIACTASALSEVKNKCNSVGMSDFLSKPFDDATLKRIIAKHVGDDATSCGTSGKTTTSAPRDLPPHLYDLALEQDALARQPLSLAESGWTKSSPDVRRATAMDDADHSENSEIESLTIESTSSPTNPSTAAHASTKTLKKRRRKRRRLPRVLLVDDNKHNRVIIGLLLKGAGCKVDTADNGQEAVDIVTSGSARYDMVMMDVRMPIMNGMDATKAIRKWESEQPQDSGHAALVPVPVIGCTAAPLPEVQTSCTEAGMTDFLSKPIDDVALKLIIAKHTDAARTD